MTNMKETAASISESAAAAKTAAENLGHTASEKLDQARAGTSDALGRAADSIRASGGHAADTIRATGGHAADSVRDTGSHAADSIDKCSNETGRILDSTSSYIGSHDATDMIHDMRTMVRRHPGTALILTASIAACLGYLAANKSNDRG